MTIRAPLIIKIEPVKNLVAINSQQDVTGFNLSTASVVVQTMPVGKSAQDPNVLALSSLVAINAQSWVGFPGALYLPNPQPFSQKDWPNPAPKPSPLAAINAQDWVFGTRRGLPTTNVQPFTPVDYPNPLIPRRPVVDFWSEPSPAMQIGLNPFKPVSYPNPVLAKTPGQDFWSEPSPALQIGLNPFRPIDYPNPILAKRNPQDYWGEKSPALTSNNPFPFNSFDWTNPAITKRTPTPDLIASSNVRSAPPPPASSTAMVFIFQ